jgi:hypothetical protein
MEREARLRWEAWWRLHGAVEPAEHARITPCHRARWRFGKEREWKGWGKKKEYDAWGPQLVIHMDLDT